MAGTRDFEILSGTVREQFVTDFEDQDSNVDGRIELITAFVAPLGDEE
jgi:hypothetical protein